jgi:peptidylprolyl isomerase
MRFSVLTRLFRLLALSVGLAAPVAVAIAPQALAADPDNTLLMQLKDGTVTIEMRPDLAPKACGAHQGAGPSAFL